MGEMVTVMMTQLVPMVGVAASDTIIIMACVLTSTIGAFPIIILRESIRGLNEVEEKNRALDLSFGPYSKGSGSTGSKIRGFSLHPKAFLLTFLSLKAASPFDCSASPQAHPVVANTVEGVRYPFLFSLSDFRTLPDKPHKNIVRMLKGKPFRKPDISVIIQDLLEKANSEGNVVAPHALIGSESNQISESIARRSSLPQWECLTMASSSSQWFHSGGGVDLCHGETSMVVRPVVDDKVFGVEREVRLVERVVVAASLGGLWWYRFREDVESLVVMVEAKK
ncbi:hypothetical protein DEO72_LG10g2180 [Vigna unguiculata]|uniref:Uncharacterized protein n=1 Tax=Vigna unguiculata TaxID=3917 RepID=A0A4D6NG71_VIGUN|nr:hypothetical protein DEO72_LG10g2180 [Vigna unguiculata]